MASHVSRFLVRHALLVTAHLPMSEDQAEVHASNNFDLLRIVAAFLVLISHQMPLTGRVEWVIPTYQSLGGIGLLIFFTMSGFLVCESWQRDPNVLRFGVRRLLRIWPGLAVAVVLTACVLGPLMSSLSPTAYFADPYFLHYFVILRFNDAGYLPDVFLNNPFRVVNGSLWTLPIEVRWYEYLALAGLLGAIRWRFVLLAITVGIAVHYFFVFNVDHAMAVGLPRGWKEELGIYFLTGACLQRFRPEWSRHRMMALGAAASLAAVLYLVGSHHGAYWIIVTVTTIMIAVSAWGPLTSVGRFGDFSYGVYIYAFPVQQTVIALTQNTMPYVAGLAISASATLFLAIASWHLVEAPSLKLKPSRKSDFGSWRRMTSIFRSPKPLSH